MSTLVLLTLLGWVPVILLLFALMPARRAVLVAFLAAWMFLPMGGFKLPGFPDYTKMSATCVGIALAAFIFDGARVIRFRPRWVDLPMAVWCLSPFASSVANGLGAYDGIASVVTQVIVWGLPYLIGRVYFSDMEGLRDLAVAIVVGGLIYVPFCLWEIRMSPQLHRWVYGYQQHSFAQTIRFGGFRPMVFMQHGLMVAMWMAAASLLAVWLWASGTVKRIWGMPMSWLIPVLLVTTVLCKSVGALLLLAGGLGVLFLVKWGRTSLPLAALVLAVPMYLGFRATGKWAGDGLVSVASKLAGAERGKSLATRLYNEDILADKALQRPIFGWGGWGRARVYNEAGKDVTVTDGLWIIALGNYGAVGLTGLTLTLLLPVLVFWRVMPSRYWSWPEFAPAAGLAVLLALYMADCIPNAMVNPVFMLAAGGMAWVPGLFLRRARSARRMQGMPGRNGAVAMAPVGRVVEHPGRLR